jgi:RHS repeat-associated protein
MNASAFAPGGSETVVTRGEYEYNGLNWRIVKKGDTDADGVLDQQRVMHYSPNWQLLEEEIDDDLPQADGDERHVQYLWGSRYIDDIVMRREDRDLDGSFDDAGDITRYYLTDAQFSVVTIIDGSATPIERTSYTPYGELRHHRRADLDGDGDVDVFDNNILIANWGSFGVGDLTRNGTVDTFDQNVLLGDWGSALPAGQLSFASEDNIIGYAGYIQDAETQLKLARNRYYNPTLGRWLTRDPIGYEDGSNLYEYSADNPPTVQDPTGLNGLSEYKCCHCMEVRWELRRDLRSRPLKRITPSIWNRYYYVWDGRQTAKIGFVIVGVFEIWGNPELCKYYQKESGQIQFVLWDGTREPPIKGKDNEITYPNQFSVTEEDDLGATLEHRDGLGRNWEGYAFKTELTDFSAEFRCVDSDGNTLHGSPRGFKIKYGSVTAYWKKDKHRKKGGYIRLTDKKLEGYKEIP